MNIVDFLPKYPNINQTPYDNLNPYEKGFYDVLFHKKEFYDNKLSREEPFPKERGMLTKYQKTIATYLSSHTPYDRLLLVHAMGLGKTCSAIGAIEQIKNEGSTFNGSLILAKGEGILNNFTQELVDKCTSGYYIPENYKKLSEREKTFRIKKKISFYQLKTFAKFAKKVSKLTDMDIKNQYSNKVIVVDEVHNLRPQSEESGSLEIYNTYHRFFHLVQNCKIIFLSGTPMKDTAEEISSVMNLLLPLNFQLPTGDSFIREYMYEKNGVNIIRDDQKENLKKYFKGYISFLREPESDIKKEFIGEEKVGKLQHLIVNPLLMSSFQTQNYIDAFNKDKQGKQGVYINSREASLFIYPDGSYGREGFQKYIRIKKVKKMVDGKEVSVINQYFMEDDLLRVLKGPTIRDTLNRIRQHSTTYATVIESILNTQGNCFVYSSLAQGSGGILFSLLLELVGFKKATGREQEPGLRYSILTNKTATVRDLRRITNRFNQRDNMTGDFIKVIIGSRAISEGYSFRNVVFESINTPHWNYSETAQAIARGLRLGSHNDLLEAGIIPTVKIMQPVAIPDAKLESIDLVLYQTSEDKDISIRSVLRLLMESAIDCALNYASNYNNGQDGSRACDYLECIYQCDGVDSSLIQQGIPNDQLDYSTYQLYYANTNMLPVKKDIGEQLRRNRRMDVDKLVQILGKQYTEEEIRNATSLVQEEMKYAEVEYQSFLKVYSTTSVQKIMNQVQQLYKTSFSYPFSELVTLFNAYTEFEVLTALRTMIIQNTVVNDKYGLPNYLREQNNTYFLVNSISISPDAFAEYYSQYPQISTDQTFESIKKGLIQSVLPTVIRKMFDTEDEKDFITLLKTLPVNVQELLIESSILSKIQNIPTQTNARDRILEYFKTYIFKVETTWISTLLRDVNIIRCLKEERQDWEDCDKVYVQKLEQIELQKEQKRRTDNPYGILGKYNPETDKFCIVDFTKEKVREVKEEDKRLRRSGKVCTAGGWKIEELVDIAINRLKIDPPVDYRASETRDTLLKKLSKYPDLQKYISNDSTSLDLRRILYFGTKESEKGVKGIKPICKVIRDWLEANNLFELDNQCGVQGKKKIGVKAVKKAKVYRLETFVPTRQETEFKAYLKDITKLMNECLQVEKYKVPIDSNLWILIFVKKTLAGLMHLDKNTVLHLCINKKYRVKGTGKDMVEQVVRYICSMNDNVPPRIRIDNTNPLSTSQITTYKSYGFKTVKIEGSSTIMEYPCLI